MEILQRREDGTPSVVELTPTEAALSELHSLLLDQGFSQSDAVILMRGSMIDPSCRSATPVLDEALAPEFTDWVCH